MACAKTRSVGMLGISALALVAGCMPTQPAKQEPWLGASSDAAARLPKNYSLHGLVGEDLGAGGGYVIAATPENIEQNKHAEAVQASQKAEQNPARVADARTANSADLNGDGFITLDEVVALQRAGLTPQEMIDRLRNTGQVFSMTSMQERYLTDRGVSGDVIQAVREMGSAGTATEAAAKQ